MSLLVSMVLLHVSAYEAIISQHLFVNCVHCAGLSDFSQYVVPRGGSFLGKWRSSFAGSSDGKMNVQRDCPLNTRYITI
jgi:hypothetical protein